MILDYLCPECREHFEALKGYLDLAGIGYEIDPRIVRGLDYYTRTVFEFVSEDIGAQGTVCGGGRYDGLIEEIGGAPTPAVGFAAGIERLLMVMEAAGTKPPAPKGPKVYLAGLDAECRKKAFALAETLRNAGISAETDHMERSVKAQFKFADKIGAEYVAVIGGNELLSGVMNVKCLADSSSEPVPFAQATEYFPKIMSGLADFASRNRGTAVCEVCVVCGLYGWTFWRSENVKAVFCDFGRYLPEIGVFFFAGGIAAYILFSVCPILIRTGKGVNRKEKRKRAAADNGEAGNSVKLKINLKQEKPVRRKRGGKGENYGKTYQFRGVGNLDQRRKAGCLRFLGNVVRPLPHVGARVRGSVRKVCGQSGIRESRRG